jgi:hypothetical protein
MSLGSLYNGTSPVLTVGENHLNRQARREFAGSLAELKKKGITDLAMELPVDFQKAFDDFAAGRIKPRQMADEIKKFVDPGYPGFTEDTIRILVEAKKQGIRVHAVDLPQKELDETPFDAAQLNKRNEAMADTIGKIVTDPSRRVVYYGGMGHTGKEARMFIDPEEAKQTSTLNNELAARGIPSQSIDIVGGVRPPRRTRPDDAKEVEMIFEEEIRANQLKRDGNRFVRTFPSGTGRKADVILHLPQKSSAALDEDEPSTPTVPQTEPEKKKSPIGIKQQSVPEAEAVSITPGMRRTQSARHIVAEAKQGVSSQTPSVQKDTQLDRAA